jgi:hypothetical protein
VPSRARIRLLLTATMLVGLALPLLLMLAPERHGGDPERFASIFCREVREVTAALPEDPSGAEVAATLSRAAAAVDEDELPASGRELLGSIDRWAEKVEAMPQLSRATPEQLLDAEVALDEVVRSVTGTPLAHALSAEPECGRVAWGEPLALTAARSTAELLANAAVELAAVEQQGLAGPLVVTTEHLDALADGLPAAEVFYDPEQFEFRPRAQVVVGDQQVCVVFADPSRPLSAEPEADQAQILDGPCFG